MENATRLYIVTVKAGEFPGVLFPEYELFRIISARARSKDEAIEKALTSAGIMRTERMQITVV